MNKSQNYLLNFINQQLNRLIQLDPEFAAKLAQLEGCSIQVAITGFGYQFFIFFSGQQISLQNQSDKKPDIIITAPPFTLLRLLKTRDIMTSLQQREIQISGDMAIARQLEIIISQFNLDWEELLAEYTNDMFAYQAKRHWQNRQEWKTQMAATCQQTIREYIQEEARWSPTRIETEHWFAAVDELTEAVERLAARVSRL